MQGWKRFQSRCRKPISPNWVKERSNKKWMTWKAFPPGKSFKAWTGASDGQGIGRIEEPAAVYTESADLLRKCWIPKVHSAELRNLKFGGARRSPNWHPNQPSQWSESIRSIPGVVWSLTSTASIVWSPNSELQCQTPRSLPDKSDFKYKSDFEYWDLKYPDLK